jgi:hypothetical protein
MNKTIVGAAVILGIALMCVPYPALAHHSFQAEFDGAKCTNITGTLTKFEWENPHGYFYLDSKDESGSVTPWSFEMVSIGWLKRSGTQRQDFVNNVGKVVTVRACLAKSGAKNKGAAETLKLPDGRTLTVGTDYEHSAN